LLTDCFVHSWIKRLAGRYDWLTAVPFQNLLDLLCREAKSRSQALHVVSCFGSLDRPKQGVENRQQIAKEIHLPVSLCLVVFPAGPLAKIIEFGLCAKQSILRIRKRIPELMLQRYLRLKRFTVWKTHCLLIGVFLGGLVVDWRIHAVFSSVSVD